MKYENNYIVICLKNHEFMNQEYKIKKIDLLDERRQLIEAITAPSIGYNEKISNNKISDPTYGLVVKMEERMQDIDIKIERLDHDKAGIERVILIFDRLICVIPLHYYILDKMLYSDRQTYKNLMTELMIGYDKLKSMRENALSVISMIANSTYSNSELEEMSIEEFTKLIDIKLLNKMYIAEERCF